MQTAATKIPLFVRYSFVILISTQLTNVVPGRWSCVRWSWRRSRLLLGTHVSIRVVCNAPYAFSSPFQLNLNDKALLSGAVVPLCHFINGSSPSEFYLRPSSIMLLKLVMTIRLTAFPLPCNSSGQPFLLGAWPSCPSLPDGLFGRVATPKLPSRLQRLQACQPMIPSSRLNLTRSVLTLRRNCPTANPRTSTASNSPKTESSSVLSLVSPSKRTCYIPLS